MKKTTRTIKPKRLTVKQQTALSNLRYTLDQLDELYDRLDDELDRLHAELSKAYRTGLRITGKFKLLRNVKPFDLDRIAYALQDIEDADTASYEKPRYYKYIGALLSH